MRHHFVPEFYLRRWAVDGQLRAYHWDRRSDSLKVSRKGAKAFCQEVDLYRLESEPLEKSNLLETKFFGAVDDKAGKVIGEIAEGNLQSITSDEQCDWVRFLMSLEARRPSVVQFLKGRASREFIDALDDDTEFLAEMKEADVHGLPSEVIRPAATSYVQDRMLLRMQEAIDNSETGTRYLQMNWLTKKLSAGGINLILADRPFVRLGGIDAPDNLWCLPLDPDTAFFCSNNRKSLLNLERANARQISKALNRHSVEQAEKYVFDRSGRNSRLLGRLGQMRSKPREL